MTTGPGYTPNQLMAVFLHGIASGAAAAIRHTHPDGIPEGDAVEIGAGLVRAIARNPETVASIAATIDQIAAANAEPQAPTPEDLRAAGLTVVETPGWSTTAHGTLDPGHVAFTHDTATDPATMHTGPALVAALAAYVQDPTGRKGRAWRETVAARYIATFGEDAANAYLQEWM